MLFVLPRDPDRETWTGRRFGVEGARERFGPTPLIRSTSFDDVLAKLLDGRDRLFFALGRDERLNQRVLEQVRRSQATRERQWRAGARPASRRPTFCTRCASTSARGARAHAARSDDQRGRARRGAVRRSPRRRTSTRSRRPSTSCSADSAARARPTRRSWPRAPNATILHYIENDRRLEGGDLLLIDAGAEYDHYCADVTRTYPVGGHLLGDDAAARLRHRARRAEGGHRQGRRPA